VGHITRSGRKIDMDIAVLLRAVPDPVEELELNDDGTDLDREFLGYVLNEFDDHALEEALLLKDEAGASVTVYALGTADEIDQMLYTALAKGADAALKIGDEMDGPGAEAQAAMFAAALQANPPDLVLCGVQSGRSAASGRPRSRVISPRSRLRRSATAGYG
jgi:electron transfer flavoprotein beta subunit